MTNTRHAVWVLLASLGCATPMKAVRVDNRRLSQSVAELRADRRAQDRKIRDLEHQLALLKVKTAAPEPVPVLPVEVVAPPAYSDHQRFVVIADDGSEIIYEGDAALGRPAVVDPPVRRAPPPRTANTAAAPAATNRLEVTHRVPPVSARTTRAPVRSDASPGAAGDDYRAAIELVTISNFLSFVSVVKTRSAPTMGPE